MMVDLEYAGPLDYCIGDVIVPKGATFEATVKEAFRRPGSVGYQVKVSLKADAAPGLFVERFVLKTNEPNAEALQVVARGYIQSSPQAAPTR